MTQIHKKGQKLFFPAMNGSKCTIAPENGGTPTFPFFFQIFQLKSLYHIPNVLIPTLKGLVCTLWMSEMTPNKASILKPIVHQKL